MTATAHALVAGAIATHTGNPILAVGLSICSHFVMDCIPHWDFGTNWRNRPKIMTGIISISDTLFGLGFSYYLFHQHAQPLTLILSLIFSVMPDWLETPWYIFFARKDKFEPSKNAGFLEKLTFAIYKTENSFHSKAQYPLGFFTQIATVGFFLLILK